MQPFADETLDDLQRDGLRLIQKRDGFRFGEDTVLLAAFAASLIKPAERPLQVADLGAGSGALSLLLAARLPHARITGVEISPRPLSVFARNIELNGLQQRLHALAGDIREPGLLPRASLDLIVSNPPYREPHRHLKRPSTGDLDLDTELSRAHDMTTLNSVDLIRSSAGWLKPGGWLALVQRPAQLPSLLAAMRDHRIEPCLLRSVVPLPGRKPSAILLAGRLHAKAGSFQMGPELLVCDRPGHYSPETAAIYGGDEYA